jgi:tetratricopeptide (TPR) repeat protein
VEEAEGLDSGSTGAGAAGASGVDPVAGAIALQGASREKADAFLENQNALIFDQRAMIADQRHHLHEQFKQLHLSVWEKRLGVLLRVATLCVGVAAAAGMVLMVRDARESNGLIVEPFSVPSDLASRGLTGQAVASRMLDKLAELQNRTQSARPPQSYANNWGKDLKVEIPETGISVGEFQRFLREWLGHDTHITGELWRTQTGVAISARAGGDSGEVVTGTEADLDNMIQKAAENVYRVTQPYRYANYLDRFYQDAGPVPEDAKARVDKADAIYRRLTYDPNPVERAWAWNGLGTQAWSARGDIAAGNEYYRKSLLERPDFGIALSALSQWSWDYGHWGEALAVAAHYHEVLPDSATGKILLARYTADIAEMQRTAALALANARTPAAASIPKLYLTIAAAQLHDTRNARILHNACAQSASHFERFTCAKQWPYSLAQTEEWRTLTTEEPQAENAIRNSGIGWDSHTEFVRAMRPLLALAKAHLGDVGGAETLIATSPLDCDLCNDIRGQIAGMAGRAKQSDAWFARVIAAAPSVPVAYADWGQTLLTRGEPDAAIEKFKLANQKGPHFADPLEGWGEALMAKSQSHLALAKFAEANKYAPNWGRLHLKWGEALAYAGKKDEATAQFARAAQLDLSASDKIELAKLAARG